MLTLASSGSKAFASAVAVGLSDLYGSLRQRINTWLAVYFVLATIFAALGVAMWSSLGMMESSAARTCATNTEYSGCAMMQDIRAILSFTLGAILCRLMMHGEDRDNPRTSDTSSGATDPDKAQLYTFML